MSKLYKLTKGSLSVIRNSREGVKQAVNDGYALDGECDDKYNIVNPSPIFDEPKKLDESDVSDAKKRGRKPSEV